MIVVVIVVGAGGQDSKDAKILSLSPRVWDNGDKIRQRSDSARTILQSFRH